LTAIGGFSVAVAVLSVGVTAGIVLLTPDPPAVRMTVAEAAAALRGRPGMLDREEGDPPSGQPAPLLRAILARELGRSPDSVRVVWQERLPPRTPTSVVVMGERSAPGTLVLPATGIRLPQGGMVVSRRRLSASQRARSLTIDRFMSSLYLTLPQPAFAASVRLANGRWLTVAPSRPLFGGWRLKVLAALAVSLLLLAPLAWLFARRLTRPFRALAAAIEQGGEPPRLQGPRELREAAGAIVQLRTRLAAEADERTRMLTAVAHDLRTPLTSLKLRIEGVAEPQRTRMAADADRMGAMIGDVLSFAREADQARRPVSVRPLVRKVINEMAAGNVALVPGPDATVRVGAEGLQRVLENLVRNAVDYAGGGTIEVAEVDGSVAIVVADTGPGIPATERARLVRPFERGDASRNRGTGGTGLGLSIVQSFADLHGGTLTLADAPGGGAEVTLRLHTISGHEDR
jgi:signal transduction histidine kinase